MRRSRGFGTVVGIALAAATGFLRLDGAAVSSGQTPTTVTIYSSLPLHGDAGIQSRDIVRGERLALKEAGGVAGGVHIRYVSLDDSLRSVGKWDPGRTVAAARRAAQDSSTIAYLGEFNSGASAISIPILNEARIPQVSPSNTYVGLTRKDGADRGEPDKYYPTGRRTYLRVAPADHIQAAAITRYMKLSGVRRVYLFHDAEVYGRGIALLVRHRLRAAGIRVVGFSAFDFRDTRGRGPVRRLRHKRFDAVFFGGITDNGAANLFNAVHRAHPNAKLFGPDGVAERVFTRRLSRGAASRMRITDTALNLLGYHRAARRFARRFSAAYHRVPEPYAIYGYEAMSLVLDAMNRAAPHATDRAAVLAALFATRDRASVLGRYSIDANGDTTLPFLTGYRVSRDRFLRYDRTLRASL